MGKRLSSHLISLNDTKPLTQELKRAHYIRASCMPIEFARNGKYIYYNRKGGPFVFLLNLPKWIAF